MEHQHDKTPLDEKVTEGGMEIEKIDKNIGQVEQELDWLHSVINRRFECYFGDEVGFETEGPLDVAPPDIDAETGLGELISKHNMTALDRMILALALAPDLQPQMLDLFYTRNKKFDRGFTEFGGIKGEQHGGFIPTGETAVFIGAGNSLETRIEVSQMLMQKHFFYKHDLIRLQPSAGDEPRLSGALVPGPELLHNVCYNESSVPEYNHKFPAKKLYTKHKWSDLVLPDAVHSQLDEITAWLDHESTLMIDWGLSRNLKPGYRSLFYGPPGTGKTMVAGLVGIRTGFDVYRIDLSQVVSKYIGETEKNLSRIFDRAEHQNWILFFDEADSLFGQRTQTKSSNDRYSNQEVSYLLQRIEDFNGVIILATNLKENIDEAFTRRFQSVINFPIPDENQRYLLWKKILGTSMPMSDDIDLHQIAADYRFAGGSIINVVRFGALRAVQRKNGSAELNSSDLQEGLRRELKKQGKTIL